MTWLIGGLAVTFGIVFFWGLVAPRSQWRVLSSWSVSRPHTCEPGGTGYAIRRLLSGLALLGMLAVLALTSSSLVLDHLPKDPVRLTPIQAMWGSPTPQLVYRMVNPSTAPDETLVAMPVLAYQDLDDEVPRYLLSIKHFSLLGDDDVAGYIGTEPDADSSPLGSANLLVQVRGPLLCVPRQAVVVETETTVQVGVYYGLPDPADGSVPDHKAGCPTEQHITSSVLVPIVLAAPLGDRTVQDLGGADLRRVRVVR